MPGKGSRQKKKKCVKASAYPCRFACILRTKKCRNPLKHGQAKDFVLWLARQEERLAKVNAHRAKKGRSQFALTESKLGITQVNSVAEKEVQQIPFMGRRSQRDFIPEMSINLANRRRENLSPQATKENSKDTVSTPIQNEPKQNMVAGQSSFTVGTATREDVFLMGSFPELAKAISKQRFEMVRKYGYPNGDAETYSRLQGNLDTSAYIWEIMRGVQKRASLRRTIVVKKGDKIEAAAIISKRKDRIHIDFLATHPDNIVRGENSTKGAGRAALLAVAQVAYENNQGIFLFAKDRAVPFYRKMGMAEYGDNNFKVNKEDMLEFIKKNTP